MALPKLFQRIFWHNNTTPAINEDNLNAMSKAIDDIDDRVIDLGDKIIEDVPIIIEALADIDTAVEAAQTAATTATTKAGEASTSATNAANSATSAGTSATTATNKAGEASSSATTASTKADEASASATTASTKAGEAATSATNAANSATAAAASASQAAAWSANPPYIGANGNWYVYDTTTSAYVDSGVDASITVDIADVTALAPDATPYVTNTGTNTDPVFHLFLPRGAKGEDGVSPIVTITTITGGHRVTIVDEDHPTGQSFDVMDGTGAGDMQAAVYDPNGTVANAGGIVDYVATHGGSNVRNFYNVQDYGVLPVVDENNYNPTAVTTALQTLINTVPAGSVLFFPVGVYRINNGITFNKRIAFVGEDTTIKTWTVGTVTDAPVSQIQTAADFPANTTMFTRQNAVVCVFRNLSFSCSDNSGHSLYEQHDNTDPFPVVVGQTTANFPYPYYKVSVPSSVEGINGILIDGDVEGQWLGQFDIENCYFYGFTGYALKIYQHRMIHNCGFANCNTCIKVTYTDNCISNCWFRHSNNAIVTEGVNNTLLNISDCWADQLAGHFISCNNTVTGSNHPKITLLVSNAWVDMVDQSAIYAADSELFECMIQGRFSRCGMTYAGASNSDWTYSISPYSDVISVWRITNCEIDVTVQRRVINSSIEKYNRNCPLKLLGRTASTINIKESRITCMDLGLEHIAVTGTSGVYPSFALGVYISFTDICCKDGDFRPYGTIPFKYSAIVPRANSPLKRIAPGASNEYAIDTSTNMIYRSTGTANTDWESIGVGKVATMPSASANELGNVFMYVGTTDSNYTHGNIYECVLDGSTYKWVTNAALTWAALTGKPFSSVGSGLSVSSDTLTADVQSVTVDSTGTASSSAVSYQRVGVNGNYTEINGTKYMEQTVTTSTSADVTATFTNAAIKADSVIEDVYNVYGIRASNIVTTAGQCVLTIPKQSTAFSLGIRIYIR